jgi:ornithine cyclodeaminase/alanine dehydrogenase-like protein (mu-crystallin family)
VVGLGIQGFHQALFACKQRKIQTLRIMDRSSEIMSRFSERFKAFYPKINVIPCKTAEELCKASEIIITATGSSQPVVPSRGGWWKGKTIIGIGSYKRNMREFPDQFIQDLEQVFVDTPVALQETGDLVIPIENGILEEKNILPIWDIMMNQVQARGETRFFKSVGMAAFDLYGAKLIYESLS